MSVTPIAVTGASGGVGGFVARDLAARQLPQRLLVRTPSKAPKLPHSEVHQVGYSDHAAASAALKGVHTLLMVSASESEERLNQHRSFVDAAATAGVQHIVYTSYIAAAPDAVFTLARDHYVTEEYIKASGMRWTFLRDNSYIDFMESLVGADGVIRGPAGSGRVSIVAREDVARLAAAVLADPDPHAGVTYVTFDTQIEQTSPQWSQSQFDAFKEVLDEFQQFDNTAGVFVGNEVLTTANGSHAAPYVLAAARDIKAYRDQKGYREIPVGYSAADIAELRPMLQNYLACSQNASERLDFFSLNAYEWCGQNTYEGSGYNQLQLNASSYNIPIFFSETGCNTAKPRNFGDQAAIFGSKMAGTWSGAMIYEWIEESNNYGIISYGPSVDPATATGTNVEDGFTRQGTPTPVQPDFDNLKAQWATLSPTGVALSDYKKQTGSISPMECPSSTSNGWAVDPSSPLPSLGQTYTKQAEGGANSAATQTASSAATSAGASSSTTSNAANPAGPHGSTVPGLLLPISLLLSAGVGAVALWL